MGTESLSLLALQPVVCSQKKNRKSKKFWLVWAVSCPSSSLSIVSKGISIICSRSALLKLLLNCGAAMDGLTSVQVD